MRPDIEIAREAEPRPIGEIAASVGLAEEELFPYGRYIAKVPLGVMERLAVAAGVAGFFALKLVVKTLSSRVFHRFAWYCVPLGLLVVALTWSAS